MQQTTSAPGQVTLHGAWTMNEAIGGLCALNAALTEQVTAQPRPVTVTVDLTEVSELDACGCQLLYIFLENLRAGGMAPAACGLPSDLVDTVRLLGFADSLA